VNKVNEATAAWVYMLVAAFHKKLLEKVMELVSLKKEFLVEVQVVLGMLLVAATFPDPTNTLTLTC